MRQLDNDCDEEIDEDVADALTFYVDSDGDGFGDEATQAQGCTLPEGSVLQTQDCDDSEPLSNPAMLEVCDSWTMTVMRRLMKMLPMH